MDIIVCSEQPVKHGQGSVRSVYTLFADTKAEVPETGTSTAYAIKVFNKTLPRQRFCLQHLLTSLSWAMMTGGGGRHSRKITES